MLEELCLKYPQHEAAKVVGEHRAPRISLPTCILLVALANRPLSAPVCLNKTRLSISQFDNHGATTAAAMQGVV